MDNERPFWINSARYLTGHFLYLRHFRRRRAYLLTESLIGSQQLSRVHETFLLRSRRLSTSGRAERNHLKNECK